MRGLGEVVLPRHEGVLGEGELDLAGGGELVVGGQALAEQLAGPEP
ncbi:MAG: hypothetical protein R3B72_36585 [Polyangiaceae bacterium]